MAKGKKQFDSAADSIFNFIFSSAKKNIRPDKPAKPSGATGNEMADGLAEIATAPLTYASEQIYSTVEEALNQFKFADSSFEVRKGEKVKIGISGSNLSGFMNDPESFIEKSFSKQEEARKAARKMNMILGIGGALDMAIGAVATKRLLKKSGITSAKALKIGRELGNEYMTQSKREEKAEFLAAQSSVYETMSDDLDEKQVEQLSKTFNHALVAIKVDRVAEDKEGKVSRNDVSKVMSERLKQFTRTGVTLSDAQVDKLVNHHLDREDKFKKKGFGEADWNLGEIGIDNRDKGLTFNNLAVDFQKAQDPANKFRRIKYENLKSKTRYYSAKASKRVSDLKKAGVTDLTKDAELNSYLQKQGEINREIGVLSIWQRTKGSDMKASRFMGEFYTQLDTFKFMFSEEGGFVALVSGDFWDDRKNKRWNPSKETDRSFKIEGRKDEVKFDKLKVGKSDFRRHKMLTSLYYLTPGSIGRTLFVNGEGFGYLAHLKENKIKDLMKRNDSSIYNHINTHRADFSHIFSDPSGKLLISSFANKDEVTTKMLDEYSAICEQLQAQVVSGKIPKGDFQKLTGQLDGMNGKLKNSRMLKYSAKLQRFWAKVNKYNPKVLINKLFTKTLQWGLTLVVGKKLAARAAKRLMGGTVALRAVIQQGIRTVVHAIAQALGMAVGGIANALIFVLTEVAMWIAEKLLRPIAKIATFVMWGVPLFLLFFILTPIAYLDSVNPFSSTSKQFDTAIGGTPIDCQECVGAGDYYDGPGVPGGESAPSYGECFDDFPHYGQNDPNAMWYGQPYGPGATIQGSGCGPTAAAMVLANLGVRNQQGVPINPLDVANFSLRNGHKASSGTFASLFPAVATHHNLNHKHITSAQDALRHAREGQPVILLGNYPPVHRWSGREGGHFVVLTGADNQRVHICDPQIEPGVGSKARTVPISVFLSNPSRGAYLIY